MQVTLSLPYLYITLSNFLFLSTSQIGLLVLYGVVSALRSSASAWSTSAGSLIFFGGRWTWATRTLTKLTPSSRGVPKITLIMSRIPSTKCQLWGALYADLWIISSGSLAAIDGSSLGIFRGYRNHQCLTRQELTDNIQSPASLPLVLVIFLFSRIFETINILMISLCQHEKAITSS